MRARIVGFVRGAPLPYKLLAVAFVLVAAWTWTWPDHPLIPDEAIAKAMADSVGERGTPFAQEPFTDYRSGAFGTDRYGFAYADHALATPPTSLAAAYEQGLLGAKFGRLVTLAVGFVAVAYLAGRIGGPWAALFGGLLHLVHPATLYFHQSYFASSGGASWFLASLALLEASRRRWWLAPLSAAAAGITLTFRIEYALGFLAMTPLAILVLRDWKGVVAFYGVTVLGFLALMNLGALGLGDDLTLFRQPLPLDAFLDDPKEALREILRKYHVSEAVTQDQLWPIFLQNVNDYFPYFFPLTALLAVAGLFARARDPSATWVYAPLAAQTLLQAYALLSALGDYDFNRVSWLESSVTRYFLVTYSATAILAGVALAAWVDPPGREGPTLPARLSSRGYTGRRAGALLGVGLACLVVSASVANAVAAEHGVAWANERRQWFDDIDAAAAALDEKAVFFGKTPGKVIFSRPLMNPENVGWDAPYTAFVAKDLLAKGHRVFALEPWYWDDHGYSMEAFLVRDGDAYWTDTGVVVTCGCGEFARFYELHRTNVTLDGVARFEAGHFAEAERGVVTAAAPALFYPERALHVRMGLANTLGVNVTLTYVDEGFGAYEAGYWNLPLENPKNEHVAARWVGEGTGETRTVSFRLTPEEVANGALYVEGPPLRILAMVVREG